MFAESLHALAPSWNVILSGVVVITMFVGNLGAIVQPNIKRLMAYSSISHVGYILIAIIAKDSLGSSSLVFYILAYAFMIFGIFGIIILMGREGDENLELDNYAGLGFRYPLLAACMSIFLLSLGGMPPLAGFVAKFYIFQAALSEGYVILVVLAVLNSAISFYYYLKVIVYMYMREPTAELQISMAPITILVIAIGLLGTLELGIFPGPVISLAQP